MAKKKKSEAPSGLSISRSNMNFTFKWKKGETYTEQTLYWRIRKNKKWSGWTKMKIGKNTTSAVLKPSAGSYYPNTTTKLTGVQFKVKGQAKNKKYSSYSSKAYSPWVPNVPTTPSFSLSSDTANTGTFTWSVSTSTTDARIFARSQYYTTLIKGTTLTDGSKINWKNATVGTDDAAGSKTITESVSVVGSDSYTRFIKVRSQGAAGDSVFRYARHVYAIPQVGTITSASAKPNGSGLTISCVWNQPAPVNHPVDTMTVDYAIGIPEEGLTCPEGASWQTAYTVQYINSDNNATFSTTDQRAGDDECVWCRVTAKHDEHTVATTAALVSVGALQAPTFSSLNISATGATVEVDHSSSVPDSFIVVMVKSSLDPSNIIDAAIIKHSETASDITFGTSVIEALAAGGTVAVGIREVQGSYTEKSMDDTAAFSVVENMVSDSVWEESTLPVAPENVSVAATETEGTVRVSWDWTWAEAVCAQIAWSDHADAWESTDDPTTYTTDAKVTSWNISDLTAGVTYYIRVRLSNSTEDNATFTPWSKTVSINLASAPTTPVMTIDKAVITESGSFTCSWAYTSGDGTAQAFGEVCEVTIANGVITPITDSSGEVVRLASVSSAQAILMSVADINEMYTLKNMNSYTWENGETHYLVCRVTSASGQRSEGSDGTEGGWSSPVAISIAAEANIEITDSLATQCEYEQVFAGDGESTEFTTEYTVASVSSVKINDTETSAYTYGGNILTFTEPPEDDAEILLNYTAEMPDGVKALTAMPFSATISGAGTGGAVTLAVERLADYHLKRPDGDEQSGYAGETIALITQTGDGTIEITLDDLMGQLDDGAQYALVGTVEDEFEQTASASVPFVVHWLHQARMPDATVVVDKTNIIAQITPEAPSNYEEGDTVDIYRLSADKPELIIKGGQYGTTYVDPYPTLGSFGGHRVVNVTANGDYITPENEIAMVDFDEDSGDILDIEEMIIDFDGERINLTYNIDLSTTWEKDFERTAYLGGSVQGDWNAAVTRDLSATAVTLGAKDTETIRAMRDLAVYAGICHVRTPDGSSFAADIQVEEEASYNTPTVTFSLTIKKIDAEDYDGMTLAEWQQAQEE